MTINELIARIEEKKVDGDVFDEAGMERLQQTAAEYDGEYKLIWSDDLLKEIQTRPEIKKFELGVEKLDELTGGFSLQQLVTIAGHTKHGKTQTGLYFIEKLHELNPVVIPLEQSAEEIITQRYDNGYSIPRFLSPSRLASSVTVDWIEERVVEGIAKYNTKAVLIDHLGYIDDMGAEQKYKRENLAYRIGMVMQELKNVAKKWNVVIFLLVHISQSDEGVPPSLKDIKNSSSIAQESDTVMTVWRKSAKHGKVRIYENKTMVSVLANRRRGRNGNVGLIFDEKTGQYEESQSWVDSMENIAKQQIEVNEAFEEYGV